MLILPRVSNDQADGDSEDCQSHRRGGIIQSQEEKDGEHDRTDSRQAESIPGSASGRDVPSTIYQTPGSWKLSLALTT